LGQVLLVAVLVRADVEDEFGLHGVLLEGQELRGLEGLIVEEGKSVNLAGVDSIHYHHALSILGLDDLDDSVAESVGQQLR
jgi:hypothetical protein